MVIRIGGGTWTDVANGTLNKTLKGVVRAN